MSNSFRYVGAIPVVPQNFSMIDFLDICKAGAIINSKTLGSDLRKEFDRTWSIVATDEPGYSSQDIVEITRTAIEGEGKDPDKVCWMVEPSDVVAIKKEVAERVAEEIAEEEHAQGKMCVFEEINGEMVEVETFDGGAIASNKKEEESSELAYKLQSPGRTVRTLFRTLTGHFGHHRTCIPDSFRTDHRTVTGQSPDRSDMNRTQIGQRQARQCPMRPSDSSDSPDTIGHRRTPSDTIGQCEM